MLQKNFVGNFNNIYKYIYIYVCVCVCVCVVYKIFHSIFLNFKNRKNAYLNLS